MIVIFDLDDTLYKEIDYLKSAYNEIALFICNVTKNELDHSSVYNELLTSYYQGKNPFQSLLNNHNFPDDFLNILIDTYRNHIPLIMLDYETEDILKYLKKEKAKLGLLTDGRSVQQRNKIKALGLSEYFENILISEEFGSEKPAAKNYTHFIEKFGAGIYFYIADNSNKDFFSPNKLGWITIGLLDNGMNIHQQSLLPEKEYQPLYWVKSINEVKTIINKHII